ncbi:MAG: LPS-assembly protein LptD [Nitrospirae bacterium]|nr:LPS-assembly protein LptD [Nitrospirota bacterium]
MAGPRAWICRRFVLVLVVVLSLCLVPALASAKRVGGGGSSSGSLPLDVTASRIDYRQDQDVYEADGSVVIQQGTIRLTADHATIQVLPGILTAVGHVHLTDPQADVTAERLELNINTEAGVVTHGQLYIPATNSLVSGRLMQRFSEYHYRAKDGSFTNCDARDGEVPAWRMRFDDLDLTVGDTLAFKGGWFCVLDVPTIPLPKLSYPLTNRQTGFLIPFVGYDNRFGVHAQGSFYWAINPSQDLTVAPSYYSRLGYGSDFEYRYILDRKSRGQWAVSYLQQTQLPNVSGVTDTGQDVKKARATVTGSHTQQFTDTLLLRANVNLVSDPNYFQQLSNSGTQRALPSNESNLLANQRLPYGNLYFLGQYLQPLQAGGKDTFQRLPETGYSLPNVGLLNSPLLFGMEGDFVNFYREQGFTLNRVNVVPGIATDVIDLGHVVGLTPQAKFREVYYTRGAQSNETQHRETFWAGVDATSKLTRRFRLGEEGSLLHTIEPKVTYEYVPGTDQSKLTQIDQVDDLPKKNLLTYVLRSRLLEQGKESAFNWLDLTLAQSYHVGAVQAVARDFTPGVNPLLGSLTQPLQPATVAIEGKKFSDIWMRAVIGNNQPQQLSRAQMDAPGFGRVAAKAGAQRPPINQYLTVDAFFDPYRGGVSQFNTDFRLQEASNWYIEVGQRFSRDGNRVRRGDLWNPISFNEVYAPTQEIQFVTAGGGFRTPWGWTMGAKGYYDVKNGRSPELDVVALYQNPCKCWSLGFYYMKFPDRQQYNFMLNLTGIGWTENVGTAVMRSILTPLLWGERGLPWDAPGGPYGRPQQVPSTGDVPVGSK